MSNTNIKTRLFKNEEHPFHLVTPSPWPFVTSCSAFIVTRALIFVRHIDGLKEEGWNSNLVLLFLHVGFAFLLLARYRWFTDIITEATFEGHHTPKVPLGLRYRRLLFIVSEIRFFFSIKIFRLVKIFFFETETCLCSTACLVFFVTRAFFFVKLIQFMPSIRTVIPISFNILCNFFKTGSKFVFSPIILVILPTPPDTFSPAGQRKLEIMIQESDILDKLSSAPEIIKKVLTKLNTVVSQKHRTEHSPFLPKPSVLEEILTSSRKSDVAGEKLFDLLRVTDIFGHLAQVDWPSLQAIDQASLQATFLFGITVSLRVGTLISSYTDPTFIPGKIWSLISGDWFFSLRKTLLTPENALKFDQFISRSYSISYRRAWKVAGRPTVDISLFLLKNFTLGCQYLPPPKVLAAFCFSSAWLTKLYLRHQEIQTVLCAIKWELIHNPEYLLLVQTLHESPVLV